MVIQGLAEKITFERRFKEGEGEKPMDMGGKSDPGRGVQRPEEGAPRIARGPVHLE